MWETSTGLEPSDDESSGYFYIPRRSSGAGGSHRWLPRNSREKPGYFCAPRVAGMKKELILARNIAVLLALGVYCWFIRGEYPLAPGALPVLYIMGIFAWLEYTDGMG